MKNKIPLSCINKKIVIFNICIFIIFVLLSCKHETKSIINFLPMKIDSFKSFFIAWVIINITFIIISCFVSFLYGLKLEVIILIIIFIIVLIIRDYGFFMTLLLFITDGIGIVLFKSLFFLFKNIK